MITDEEYAKASFECRIANLVGNAVENAYFQNDTITDDELEAMLACVAKCDAKHSEAVRKLMKRSGEERLLAESSRIIFHTGIDLKKTAEDWLREHLDKDVYELIHDDVMKELGLTD